MMVDGRRVLIPVEVGTPAGAIYQHPEDVSFTDRNGDRWLFGSMNGVRVRFRG